jgi:uncharacterized protein
MTALSISSLWRYPVKSMAGEELDSIDVTATGLHGDRAYALVDSASRRVGSAKSVKKFGELLKWKAQFKIPPRTGHAMPGVRLTHPDGASIDSDQPDMGAMLAATFGPHVTLQAMASEGLMLEFAAGTLGGKHIQSTEVPIAGGAPKGTFFDYGAIHLVTTSTVRHLQGAHASGEISIQRFRPNLVVDSGSETGFVENAWIGRTFGIGPELTLRVSIPCPRCVMATLPRAGLPSDPALIRLIARMNTLDLGEIGRLPCVGVYAEVVGPGRVQRGDRVRLID